MRTQFLTFVSLTLLGAFGAVAPAGAQAFGPLVLSSGHMAGLCLERSGNQLVVRTCSGDFSQQVQFSGYGPVRIQGLCVGTSANRAGAALATQSCNGSRGQQWKNTGEGWLKNEEGWCADIQGGGGAETPVIAWECKTGARAVIYGTTNQRWSFSRFVPASALSPRAQQLVGWSAGKLISKAELTAAGVIAPGGANVVASGGGNVVASGGGNVIAPGGANVVAAGGGNVLVPQTGLIAGQ